MSGMKKYIAISFVALAAFAVSCKDFLVEEPILSQSNELTLSTYDGLDKATAGAYSPLASSTWYGASFVIMNEMHTMNGKKFIGSDFDSGRCNDYYNLNYNENNTTGLWGYGYFVISAVNNVMDNLEGKESDNVTVQDLNNLKAECLFLRALSHFDLVRTYAQPYCYTADASHMGVPVVLKTDPSALPARNTVKEVYEQIIADLKEAESIIDPAYVRSATDTKATANIYAIQALLSRVYLYAQQWQNAADYATKVINSGKYKMWTAAEVQNGDIYAVDVPTGGEVIFEIYGLKSNSYDGYHDGISPMTGPGGYGDAGCSADLIALYDANDVRSTLFQEQSGVTWTAKYKGKGLGDPDVNNTIVLRLSEMYLNRAEAIANGASVAGCSVLTDLQTIYYNRVFDMENAATVGTDMNAVWSERQKELAWEAHYWFDLGRTKRPSTRTDFVGSPEAKDVPWPSHKWAMPIPMRETGVNPNLVQNEGY